MWKTPHFLKMILSLIFITPFFSISAWGEEETLCAVVKIEIRQELTLERQAFDAHMRIKNGLTHAALENVSVEVHFTDENKESVIATSDASDTSATFFIREDTKNNIDNVTGTGSVAASTTADIHWMIIPSPGASNGVPAGKLYYVGARLTYTIGGEENITVVTPDYIFVKPMPDLVLDYFLPEVVYGDDAFTPEIEPAIPFSLGIRVSNKGFGTAKNLKIDSAQPKIVDNEQGLLVGFSILGSDVKGDQSAHSLLVDFGDIPPESAASARFLMTATLSGRFTAFSAAFSHSDELGGELTSLIDTIQTHTLIQNVLVDLPGRDLVRDFLAKDGDTIRVYETDATSTVVTDQSNASHMVQTDVTTDQHRYTLESPQTAGFSYLRLPDPENGGMVLKSVIRSDGKAIKPDNFWQAKQRKATPSDGWDHFIHLFDMNTHSSYSIIYETQNNQPRPPNITPIFDQRVVEADLLNFTIQSDDPDSEAPRLSVSALPFGAGFTDHQNGTGTFNWTPAIGQAGLYPVTFNASDGVLKTSKRVQITVLSIEDTDGDGMKDSWEMAVFGTLERDGSMDFDGDGISDLDEYLMGSDPKAIQSAPSIPVITAPKANESVAADTVTITIENSTDADGDTIAYEFEIYADKRLTDFVEGDPSVPETPLTTEYVIKDPLVENQSYTFRVRAKDGYSHSLWRYGQFFINRENEAPGPLFISYPADGTSVNSLTPTLESTLSSDSDNDPLTYDMAIFEDRAMTQPVGEALGLSESDHGTVRWQIDVPLTDGVTYFWQAKAVDPEGSVTLSPPSAFSVNLLNHPPSAPSALTPTRENNITETFAVLSAAGSTDDDGDTITYIFQLDRSPHFNSPHLSTSAPISPSINSAIYEFSNLLDNTPYYFRVKASDGVSESPWVKEAFFVNLSNNAPAVPTIKNPGEYAWTDSMLPNLTITPTTDPDQNPMAQNLISHEFEIYQDQALTRLIAKGITQTQNFQPRQALPNHTFVYFRVRALDTHNAKSAFSTLTPFFINDDGIDAPPELSFSEPSQPVKTNASHLTIGWDDSDPDSNAAISLFYDTDTEGADGVMITDTLKEDPDGLGDQFSWDISALNGTFYIYAMIRDETETKVIYSPHAITIDRIPPMITPSPAGGVFQGDVLVTLTSDEPAAIHYTLDGSPPTPTSPVMVQPLLITEDTTLNFMAMDALGNQSRVFSETYTIEPSVIAVRVKSSLGYPLSGLKVQAFKTEGSYAGFSAITDANGTAAFSPEQFSDGNYTFRITYLRIHFFSEAITIPDRSGLDVIIEEAPVTVNILAASEEASGIKVYLFSENERYLGRFEITDEKGDVVFNLPVGHTFKFRATLLGSHYFTDAVNVSPNTPSVIELNTGGGLFTVRVEKNADLPLANIPVYLFSETDQYLKKKEISSDTGEVRFKVSRGTYKVRADYLGYRFFSEPIAVITDTTQPLTILHQPVNVLITRKFNESITPAEGIKVFLFTESGKYVSLNQMTNESGMVSFDLPEKAYKVRLDDFRSRFWSEPFTWQDASVIVPMAEAEIAVTGAGLPQQGLTVFAFNAAGAYLGIKAVTDTNGLVRFRLPEGSYAFRTKYMGNQYWSPETVLLHDTTVPVTLSVGGGGFKLLVTDDRNTPLPGIKCHVYNQSGQYIQRSDSTDETGTVHFELAEGNYRIKAVYLADEYMSADLSIPSQMDATIIIPHETVETIVTYAGQPAKETKIYLYSEDKKYLGQYEMTDSDGRGFFYLPVGKTVLFRSDILKNRYFSEPLTISSGSINSTRLDARGGLFQVRVEKSETEPLEKIPVYLFNEADRYTGLKSITDSAGVANFHVPKGTFKVRADYMRYPFLSPLSEITSDTTTTLSIPHKAVEVTVAGTYQGNTVPIADSDIFLLTPTDHYTGLRQKTDASGKTVMILPEVPFYLRAHFKGHHFVSSDFNATDTTVTIPMAKATITVKGGGMPSDRAMVYLYSDKDKYLGTRHLTGENGSVTLDLPIGTYKFKAAYQKNTYWSAPIELLQDAYEYVSVSVGGGNLTFTLNKEDQAPLGNIQTHVFNPDQVYLGLTGATNDQGTLSFKLASGTVKFRMSYLRYHFWTPEFQIPQTLEVSHLIPHRWVTFKLLSRFQEEIQPIPHTKIHLFSETDRAIGLHGLTDDTGSARFELPEKPFKARFTYFKDQYWSKLFTDVADELIINHGKAAIRVNRSGEALASIRVYLFDETQKYSGVFLTTDASGSVTYLLPENTYHFMVRLNGQETFSQATPITKDTVSDVLLEVQ